MIEISSFSHQGHKRKNNEDSYLVIPPWKEPALTAKICLFAVADGVGGHVSGEIASKLAVSSLFESVSGMNGQGQEFSSSIVETMVTDANHSLRNHIKIHPECDGMGTTLTAAAVSSSSAIIGHVGDTRAYLLRDGTLQQITRDHTLVSEQVRLGSLTPEQAQTHPGRHILSRVMGPREFINVDIYQIDLKVGDIITLLSDGITGLVPDDEIRKLLSEDSAFAKKAELLVDKANQAGGVDNSTAVIFKINEIPVNFPAKFSVERAKAVIGDYMRG
ncbi:MAG: serine/threonine-protein phosphatase [Candidatus Riflebacteria bacterium]|nr:serine/threonine-protein phosphatase [Candidatus Riflebacteria bacterium]